MTSVAASKLVIDIASQNTHTLASSERKDGDLSTVSYDAQKMIGHGSFGAVFLAIIVETGEQVAIKKVLQDKRFKSRELELMKQFERHPHPFVVRLKHHFTSYSKPKTEECYLNLVLEYIPETIHSVAKYYSRRKEVTPIASVKIYMYQLSRALAHIHGMGICHRDIKPHNLLVDPVRHILKLCDFGSAKAFTKGEPNVAYICSRFYRAPELIFGSTDYSTSIDVWSSGCVFAELLIGSPIFPGSSGVDQLVEIVKILGTPTKDELKSMNPNYQEFKFPQIRSYPWSSIFKPATPMEAVDLVSKILVYVPDRRYKAIDCCAHAFFQELRLPGATLPDGSPLMPELFQFTNEELSQASPEVRAALAPAGSTSLHVVSIVNNGPPATASGGGVSSVMATPVRPAVAAASLTASGPPSAIPVAPGSQHR